VLSSPPPNQLVVAEEEGRIVGFACAYGAHDADGSFLDNMHADPDRHGEGIGSGLFWTVVDWCRGNFPGCGLHLKVLERNTKARHFYEGFGGVDRGGTPPSSPWVVERVEVRQYAWSSLDGVPAPRRTTATRRRDHHGVLA
jgi:GNAT superfamily N-acetyltransferase